MKTPKQKFIEYGLKSLGWPVVNINIDDDQIEDRVIEAVQYYNDFHIEGTEQLYYHYPSITQIDISNGYINLPNNITSVVKVFNLQDKLSSKSSNYIIDLRYQLRLNQMWDFTSASFLNFHTTLQHLRTLEILFSGEIPFTYQRYTNTLHIFQAWGKNGVNVGDDIMLEVYVNVDPEEYPRVYEDKWLKKYFCALLKRQWGTNMLKYDDVVLVGGVRLNGWKIFNQAQEEILQLEEEMQLKYSAPLEFYTN